MSSSESSWIRCNGCVKTLPERRLYLTNCNHIFCLLCLGADVENEEVICPECTSRTHILEINKKMRQDKLIFFRSIESMIDRTMKGFNGAMKMVSEAASFQRRQYEATIKKMSIEREEMTSLIDKMTKENEDLVKDKAQLSAALMDRDPTIKEKNEVISSGLKRDLSHLNSSTRKDNDEIDELKAEIDELRAENRWFKRLLAERNEPVKVLSEKNRELRISPLNVGGFPRVIPPEINPNSLGICRRCRTNMIGRQGSKCDVSLYYQKEVVKTMGRDMRLPDDSTPVKKPCLRGMASQQFPKTPNSKVRFSEMEEIIPMEDSDLDLPYICPNIGHMSNISYR
uniref:RING-type domain-containing protein n=1 Tax=Strongyloides papillosus TaxID=174720 RepID=A0A0N5C1U3_STREA